MCKLVREDGTISDYDSAKFFSGAAISVANLADLSARLRAILRKPRCCVVRGALLNGPRVDRMRRLVYADRVTGDPATLDDVAQRWLALDMDGLPLPDEIPPRDIQRCASHAITALPKAFHGAACVAQASAGHGIKPGLRLRLWYWLDRPLRTGELTRWLHDYPVDKSVFRPAQPIYTAAPVFENPEQDPIPERIVDLPGAPLVVAPSQRALAAPARSEPRLPPLPTDTHARRYAAAAMTNAAIKVSAAPVNSRHETCLREARSLGRLVQAGLLSAGQVKELLGRALEAAGKQRKEGEAIAAWGLEHPTGTTLPNFTA